MRKIKLIFTAIAFALFTPSCEKDGGDSVLNLDVAAVPNITKVADTDAFINLIAINNDEQISISFTVDEAQGEVASMDVVLFYIKGSTVQKATFASNVTTFPVTYTLSQTDLINAFDGLNAAADFELGDQLIVTTELTLKNGTVVKILNDNGTPSYGGLVANSPLYKVIQVYNVACPSDLGGTYNAISSGSSTDSGPTASENPISNYPYTVTITDNGGGNYTISDAFGGLYLLWYDIYGITGDEEGTFDDVCGTISGEFLEPFGTNVTYTGSVDPDSGVITIDWINGYDDQGTMVLTKVN